MDTTSLVFATLVTVIATVAIVVGVLAGGIMVIMNKNHDLAVRLADSIPQSAIPTMINAIQGSVKVAGSIAELTPTKLDDRAIELATPHVTTLTQNLTDLQTALHPPSPTPPNTRENSE